jgi:hypothetical protein
MRGGLDTSPGAFNADGRVGFPTALIATFLSGAVSGVVILFLRRWLTGGAGGLTVSIFAGIVVGALALKVLLGLMDADVSLQVAVLTVAGGTLLPLLVDQATGPVHPLTQTGTARPMLPTIGVGISAISGLVTVAIVFGQAFVVQNFARVKTTQPITRGAMRVVLAGVVIAVVAVILARNSDLPFVRLFHRNSSPGPAHITNHAQATSYVTRTNSRDTAVTCEPGTDGWTDVCPATDPALGHVRIALFTRDGTLRASRILVPGSTLAPPRPDVSVQEFASAVRAACARHRADLRGFPPDILADPALSRTGTQLLIEIENAFGRRLYAAGSPEATGPNPASMLYDADFKQFQTALGQIPGQIGHANLVQTGLQQLRGAETSFDSDARKLGIDCWLP